MTHLLPTLKRLPLLSELALVVLLAWMITGWLLPPQQTQQTNTIENIAIKTTSLPDLNKMLVVKLFGQAPQKAKTITPAAPQPQPVIRQPLTLKLLGTVVAAKNSAAIIAIRPGATQQAFFIGDIIQPGVTLKSVEATSIMVDRNGALERITLEEVGKLNRTPAAATIIANPGHRPTGPINKTMNRVHLQQQLNNFPALLSQARAAPHFVNGKMAGFSVTNIVPGSLYQQAGLQNGDIIVSVNGEKITGAQQAMGIYTKLKSSPSLDLELIRAGGMQSIHYNIR